MKRSNRLMIVSIAVLVTLASAGTSQAGRTGRTPSIGYVYPAGGRQGETFEVTLAGRYLTGISGVVISGGGVKAELVEYVRPLNGKEINLLRDEQKELMAKLSPGKKNAKGQITDRPKTEDKPGEPIDKAAIRKRLAEIKAKLANPKNRNRTNPQLGEDVRLKVTIAPDAKCGKRELMLQTAAGLTNPVSFIVDRLPQYCEAEPNNKEPDPNVPAALPLVINGRILPGDIDRFQLHLKEGMHLVVAVSARELTPYIADAVPGWFQATVALYDPNGNELAYDDDYRFNPDPVILYKVPHTGLYSVEVKDAIYRGREDFVYRITVGELPFVTSIYPIGGQAGAITAINLTGWNLPENVMTIDAKGKSPGIIPVSFGHEHAVDDVLFELDSLPDTGEVEPDNSRNNATKVQLPIIVNGRIDEPGDTDFFSFEGKKGQEVVAEVKSRRLNCPLDSMLRLTDSSGKEIASNDDFPDKAAGLVTHQADSYVTTTLPADGRYYIELSDTQGKGGRAYAYRLRISQPQPDFALRATPSSLSVRAGAAVPITIYAIRKDGFTGNINISLKKAPEGFRLNATKIPADKDKVQFTLRTLPTVAQGDAVISLEGTAEINGVSVAHRAVPAEDMMQAFIYWHLVPVDEMAVAVLPRPAQRRATGNNNRKPQQNKAQTDRKPQINKKKPAGKAQPKPVVNRKRPVTKATATDKPGS